VRVFSNRYLKAIYDKQLKVIVPSRLRKRLWLLLEANNFDFIVRPNPGDSWEVTTDVITELMGDLRLAYGEEKLEARLPTGARVVVNSLKEFFEGCYPSQVLDVVEAFWHRLSGLDSQTAFTGAVNEVFEDASCAWRLDDGEFFAVDQTFMGLRLAEMAEQSLKQKAFHGAYEEFREAREDLMAGDTKGCISNAQKAFESAMKTLLGIDKGNASVLIRQFVADGYVDDLPAEFKTSFGEQVLMSVPTMGNRLGRHGQGATVVNVPPAYAQLTLEMVAAYLNFLVKLRPSAPQPAIQTSAEISDDDIPF
jgi:hypothetical protein